VRIRGRTEVRCGGRVAFEPDAAPVREETLFRIASLTKPMGTDDEFAARLAALPLACQPGEGWLYDSGANLLGVLLARATGTSLSDLMAERVTGPLGMADTSFGMAPAAGSPPPIFGAPVV